MECPRCKEKTKVIDSRLFFGEVKRNRRCAGCYKTFTTMETLFDPRQKVKGACRYGNTI